MNYFPFIYNYIIKNSSKFLKNFYNYCSKNTDDYKTKWTDWLKSNNQA